MCRAIWSLSIISIAFVKCSIADLFSFFQMHATPAFMKWLKWFLWVFLKVKEGHSYSTIEKTLDVVGEIMKKECKRLLKDTPKKEYYKLAIKMGLSKSTFDSVIEGDNNAFASYSVFCEYFEK